MRPKRVIIDTDPGVDDALALLLALESPELELVAVTSVAGNVPLDRATENVLSILDLAGEAPLPPVAAGADRPLAREPVFADFLHGEDGLGGAASLCRAERPGRPPAKGALTGRAAAEEILQQVRSASEPLTLIALGPLTNVALALARDARALDRLERIVIMGGAMEVPGNVTPAAEFNFYVDPEAADAVLRSGLPITLVGLDVTTRALLTQAEVREAADARPLPRNRFIEACTAGVFDVQEAQTGHRSMPLHDPLAVAAVIAPSLVVERRLAVAVETKGELTRGMCVSDRRGLHKLGQPPNASVCVDVDQAGFLNLFRERVLWPRSS